MITSIICIVFGVMFCIWPGTILVTLCRIAGLVMLAAGIVLLVQGIRIREMLGRSVRMLPAVVCVVIGIWILARPGVFVSLIPILIGVMLAYHGFKDLVFCLEVKKASSPRWWIGLLVAIATIIIGVILMLHTWLALEIGMMAVSNFSFSPRFNTLKISFSFSPPCLLLRFAMSSIHGVSIGVNPNARYVSLITLCT